MDVSFPFTISENKILYLKVNSRWIRLHITYHGNSPSTDPDPPNIRADLLLLKCSKRGSRRNTFMPQSVNQLIDLWLKF